MGGGGNSSQDLILGSLFFGFCFDGYNVFFDVIGMGEAVGVLYGVVVWFLEVLIIIFRVQFFFISCRVDFSFGEYLDCFW